MSQPPRPLHLPSGAIAPPSKELDQHEKLNMILRTLVSSRLQRGEPRVEGLYLAVGSLADVVRDQYGLLLQLADKMNELIDRNNALTAANERREREYQQIMARKDFRGPRPVRLVETAEGSTDGPEASAQDGADTDSGAEPGPHGDPGD